MRTPGVQGFCFGIAAVVAWAFYNVGVAKGRADGFSVADLTLLRYLGAVIALSPLLFVAAVRKGKRLGAWKLLALLALAGPHFGLLYAFGMPLTRLSHAVVISPGASMLVAVLLTSLSTRTPPGMGRCIGLLVLLGALVIIGFGKTDDGPVPISTWRGDLIFILTGTLYGTFAYLLGRWQGSAILVTWQISLSSLLLVLPPYVLFAAPRAMPMAAWIEQLVYQGALGGGWAVVFYTLSIRFLGSDRASIFPALVPASAVLLSIPLIGGLPGAIELTGTAVAAIGMILSLRRDG